MKLSDKTTRTWTVLQPLTATKQYCDQSVNQPKALFSVDQNVTAYNI